MSAADTAHVVAPGASSREGGAPASSALTSVIDRLDGCFVAAADATSVFDGMRAFGFVTHAFGMQDDKSLLVGGVLREVAEIVGDHVSGTAGFSIDISAQDFRYRILTR